MGCELSIKYPEICLKDEAKIENLMGKYCGQSKANQESKISNLNYGILNVVTDEESIDERTSQSCSWHYTDTMECLLIGILMTFMIRVLYRKFQEYRTKQKAKKLAGLWVIYQQALDTRSLQLSPTAPTQIQTHTPRDLPYQGIQSDVYTLKGPIK